MSHPKIQSIQQIEERIKELMEQKREIANHPFRNIKIGNRVFDILKGWGTVMDGKSSKDFVVNMDNDEVVSYYFSGKIDGNELISRLYWNVPEIKELEEDEGKKRLIGIV